MNVPCLILLAALDLGSQRELFLDRHVIDRLQGGAELQLHHPVPQEIVLQRDAPWEGCGSGMDNVFRDGDIYRLYYRGWQIDPRHEVHTPKGVARFPQPHPPYWCYAESDDGIHWRKPSLGQVEFQGSKENNIIRAEMAGLDIEANSMAVFRDDNPGAAPDERYKAMLLTREPRGLLPFKSADGLHWLPMTEAAVVTDGAFDSQNLAFWDGVHRQYRAYWRYFITPPASASGGKSKGYRAIRTAVSQDFVHWTDHADLRYGDAPLEELYTNQVYPYARAPQILIGFPTRYLERGWSDSMRALPDRENREHRALSSERYGTALSEILIMSSRDGVTFRRWNEAFMRPGIERPGSWAYGDHYIAWQPLRTKSDLPGAPDELSFYDIENYWLGTSNRLRRYTLRLDGFVSAAAPLSGGELITKPLRFQGSSLSLNFSTSAAGSVRVELQDADAKPLAGFALSDCPPLFGDTIERAVAWQGHPKLAAIAGREVRLRFELRDADLYSFRFAGE